MCLPKAVLGPYMYMLRHASRRYKTGVNLDKPQDLHGGMLQGCPLSTISMNCLVNLWLRYRTRFPRRPRSWMLSLLGAKVNQGKCFSFGHKGVSGQRFDVVGVLFNSPSRRGMVPWQQIDSLPDFQGVVTDMSRRSQHELGAWLDHVRAVWRRSQWAHCA